MIVQRDPLLDTLQYITTAHNYSTAFVANKSGVSKSTIRAWETGRTRRPLATTLAAVARVYGYQLVLTKK